MVKESVLITLADKNYIEQAKQLFSSVYWNAGWKGDYLLLSHNVSEKDLKWFRKKGILIKKVKLVTKEKVKSSWPITVFSKFYIFTPYFKKYKNVLFLDSDIIVRESLKDLSDVKGLWAVKSHEHMSKLFIRPVLAKLRNVNTRLYKDLKKNYNLKLPAFNSGVIAFSTDIIKKDLLQELKKLFNKYKGVNEGDETFINLLMYKKWNPLNQVYNIYPDYIIPTCNIPPEKVKGIILHFIINKPWDTKSPFHKEWKENLDRAEEINLKKPQELRKVWTKQQIKKYSDYLNKRKKSFFYKKIKLQTAQLIDEGIGLIGLTIKRINPETYYKLKKIKEPKQTDEKKFKEIYKSKWWGDQDDFFSGQGSLPENTKPYEQYVEKFIKDNKIKSVVDLGCGDFQVGKRINWSNAKYIGVDIVKDLIKRNKKLYSNKKIKFIKKDIVKDKLPSADLCLIREVLQHMEDWKIKTILKKIKKYKYVLITNIQEIKYNKKAIAKLIKKEYKFGEYRGGGLFLDLPPFNLKSKTVLSYLKTNKKHRLKTILVEN